MFKRNMMLIALVAGGVISGARPAHAYTYALEAFLKMDDGSGTTAADASGNGRSAALYGDAAFTGSGHAGGAVTLDGTGDYLEFTDQGAFNLYDEVTVCAWVNLSGPGAIVARGSYINPLALYVNSGRTVTAAVNTTDGGDQRYTTSATITNGTWQHVAMTYSAVAGSSKVYINGQPAGGLAVTGFLTNLGSAETWWIGRRGTVQYLTGQVDDVRIYSRPASAAEILAIYNGTEVDADTDAPSVPTGLSAAAASPRMVALSWSKSTDNVKVAGYRVFKNGAWLATTHEDSAGYLVCWLEPATQYSFTVSAVDHGGNESARSAAAAATTDRERYPDYYVGGGDILNEMDGISAACLETLKTKHVVGITKSFGGSMVSGYGRLRTEGSPYYLASADIGSPSASDFDNYVIIKADTTRYPYTFRIEMLGEYLRTWAAPVVDAGFVFFHNMTSSIYTEDTNYPFILNRYITVFDSIQQVYPQVKIIYTCAGVVGESDLGRDDNLVSVRFNEMLVNRKRGLAPIYDMASLLSVQGPGDTSTAAVPYADYPDAIKEELDTWTDAADRLIKPDTTACPQIPASGLHPDAAGEKRMALGMTLILAKVFCPDCFPQEQDTTPKSWVTDSLAIRAILDANGLPGVAVNDVVEETDTDGRVATLSLRDPALFTLTVLPGQIGELTALKILYVYSNGLTTLPPEIGRLTELERLNVSENKLTALPPEIGRLTKLQQLTADHNLLTDLPEELLNLTSLVNNIGIILDSNSICDTADLSPALNAFLDQKSANWKTKQSCGTGVRPVRLASAPQLPFTLEHTPAALTVRWEKGTVLRLALYDVNGARLGSTPAMNGGEASFDVRTLGTGLYLLKVNQNGRVYTVKLAIVKQ